MKNMIYNFIKRAVSLLIVLTMCINCFGNIIIHAESNVAENFYIGNGYIVYYSIIGEWEGYQNIEIKIENTGESPITNWALKYDAHGRIDNIWNAEIYSVDDTKYIVRNAGYNYEILPSQTVCFGYTLANDKFVIPEVYELSIKRVERKENISVSYDVSSEWDNGFVCNVTIENNSNVPIEAW